MAAARLFFFGMGCQPTVLQSHHNLNARHASDVYSRVFQAERTRSTQILLHRRHRQRSSPTKCQDSTAARLAKPMCAKSSNTRLSSATTIALSWSNAPCSMSGVIISMDSPGGEPSNRQRNANARSKLPRLETTIAQSVEVALPCLLVFEKHRMTQPREVSIDPEPVRHAHHSLHQLTPSPA